MKTLISCKNGVFALGVAALMSWALLAGSPASYAQTTAATLSPDLQEIVKFAQAKMADDVVISYIKGSGKVYNMSGDDMIYLTGQGVSQPVLSALLATKTSATPPPAAPAPAPAPTPEPPPVAAAAPLAPPPGLVDIFSTDAGLNPSLWVNQSPLLQTLAQWNHSANLPPMLAFGPAGMQMSGVNGPDQFTGIQSAAMYAPPFTFTATVSGMMERGVPFEIFLVSPDLRQFFSVTGHLGGAGGPREELGIRVPFGAARIPLGREPSPEHGVWVNWTGSGQPISALGNRIFPEPRAERPYTIQLTVGADGIASVSLQDPAGLVLGGLNAMPVGLGPFNVVLAARREGPTFANWQSVQLTPMGPPPPAPVAVAPEAPTLDYFQAHLGPYGQWIDVPGVGPAWVPAEASDPFWRPYMNAGHWEYTDAGWFWQSDYPYGDIVFHYGRWIKSDLTAFRWAWVPGYDWAPSWVAWREGEGGMGWAPLPWGVEYRTGVGLFWHGGPVGVDVDFGMGFDLFVFVGHDHFFGGGYEHYAYPPDRARVFFEHSQFHAGYRMEGGHLRAEGLGRDHIAAITHHEVVERRAMEMRHAEETHNVAVRAAAHPEVARHPPTGSRPEAARRGATPERGATPGREATTPERGAATPGRGAPTPERGATTPGRGATQTKPATPAKPAKPEPEKKPNQ